jgi:hypothetical protein
MHNINSKTNIEQKRAYNQERHLFAQNSCQQFWFKINVRFNLIQLDYQIVKILKQNFQIYASILCA